jgi:hypothetical protein
MPGVDVDPIPPISTDVQLTQIPDEAGLSIYPGLQVQDITPNTFCNTAVFTHLQETVEASQIAKLLHMQTLLTPNPRLKRSDEQVTQAFDF